MKSTRPVVFRLSAMVGLVSLMIGADPAFCASASIVKRITAAKMTNIFTAGNLNSCFMAKVINRVISQKNQRQGYQTCNNLKLVLLPICIIKFTSYSDTGQVSQYHFDK
jgi:hypothetical protein